MFSQTAEYALRAAVALANAGSSLTTAEIAGRTRVPAQYLSKVLQNLGKAGLVEALRGKRGGYRLARPPQHISVLDVLNATSPLTRIHSCPLGLPAHTRLCPLHQHLDDALALVETRLAQRTLAELLGDAGPSGCFGLLLPPPPAPQVIP